MSLEYRRNILLNKIICIYIYYRHFTKVSRNVIISPFMTSFPWVRFCRVNSLPYMKKTRRKVGCWQFEDRRYSKCFFPNIIESVFTLSIILLWCYENVSNRTILNISCEFKLFFLYSLAIQMILYYSVIIVSLWPIEWRDDSIRTLFFVLKSKWHLLMSWASATRKSVLMQKLSWWLVTMCTTLHYIE